MTRIMDITLEIEQSNFNTKTNIILTILIIFIIFIILIIYLDLFKALYSQDDKGAKYTNKAKSIVFNVKVKEIAIIKLNKLNFTLFRCPKKQILETTLLIIQLVLLNWQKWMFM